MNMLLGVNWFSRPLSGENAEQQGWILRFGPGEAIVTQSKDDIVLTWTDKGGNIYFDLKRRDAEISLCKWVSRKTDWLGEPRLVWSELQ